MRNTSPGEDRDRGWMRGRSAPFTGGEDRDFDCMGLIVPDRGRVNNRMCPSQTLSSVSHRSQVVVKAETDVYEVQRMHVDQKRSLQAFGGGAWVDATDCGAALVAGRA